MYIYIHTYIHTCMHTNIHTNIQLSGKGLHTPNGIIGYARKERNSQDGGEFEEW